MNISMTDLTQVSPNITANMERTQDIFTSDLEARQQRWGSFLADLEHDFDDGDIDGEGEFVSNSANNNNNVNEACLGGDTNDTSIGNNGDVSVSSTFNTVVNNARETAPAPTHSYGLQVLGTTSQSFYDWIRFYRDGICLSIFARKEYLERSVRLFHSLVVKVGSENVSPASITGKNIVVTRTSTMGGGDCADFISLEQSSMNGESKEVVSDTKYDIMNSLGIIAYELFMHGERPPVSSAPSNRDKSDALTLNGGDHYNGESKHANEDDKILDILRKTPRTTLEKDTSGITAIMLDAGVPYPLCTLVADLLDGNGCDGGLFRSDNSFTDLSEIISDLEQMLNLPDAFLHASVTDRWKIAFGEKMYGRETETETLLSIAARVRGMSTNDAVLEALDPKNTETKQQVVMVSGPSGSGKSRLVIELRAPLEKQGWIFLGCKFDRFSHAEPLSVISHAFEEYLAMTPHEHVRARLEKAFNPEGLFILSKRIPSLCDIFRDVTLVADASCVIDLSEKRLHHLFGHLLRALSLEGQPIAIFLDDLQWADSASLELFTALVQGDGLIMLEEKLLFIGCYRDDEIDENHRLAKILNQFEEDSAVEATSLSIARFSMDTLNEMLSYSMCLPRRRTKLLSEVVMQKTNGLVIHIIEFLGRLTKEKLLTHSLIKGWEWDSDLVDVCPISDDVAELFTSKLQELPSEVLLGLQVLSCFGFQADERVLNFMTDYDGEGSLDMMASIETALDEGLVKKAGPFVSFSHDKIQESAFDSIKRNDLTQLLRKIASALIKNASIANDISSILFVVVDLTNRIGSDAVVSLKERDLYASLNDKASRKALAVPDFASALKYAEYGISFLGDDHWESQYNISLSLYETSISAQYSCPEGCHNVLVERIEALLQNAKQFDDKFNTTLVYLKVLSTTDLQQAINEGHRALDCLGEPIFPSEVNYDFVRTALLKQRELFRGDKKREFLSLTPMKHPNKAKAMKIMELLLLYYYKRKSIQSAYFPCRMVELSSEFGFCEESVLGAAFFASSLINLLDDIDEGCQWGHLALSLLSRSQDINRTLPKVYLTVYWNVLPHREPLQSTLEPLFQGYRMAFTNGDIECALLSATLYFARSFNTGVNIQSLIDELEAFSYQHRKQVRYIFCHVLPLYVILCKFRGVETKALLREKTLVQLEESLAEALKQKDFAAAHAMVTYQTMHAFIFRDLNTARRLIEMHRKYFGGGNIDEPLLKYVRFNNM